MRASGRHTAPLPQGQPQPSVPSIENNFVAGLKTEYTGLNFPENAFTDATNCTINRVGNVTRRNGMDFETGFTSVFNNNASSARSSFLWTNAGGDGNSTILVQQVGATIRFFLASSATLTSPLSTTIQSGQDVVLSNFSVPGAPIPDQIECTYAAGNGYLFVYHPNLTPFYCSYVANAITNQGVITANPINVSIRDFTGITENVLDTYRPARSDITNVHLYNLQNQGWTSSTPWSTLSGSVVSLTGVGNYSFTVSAGLPIILGTSVNVSGFLIASGHVISGSPVTLSGIVNFYSGNTISISATSFFGFVVTSPPGLGGQWTISPTSGQGQLSTWVAAIGNYPSNADVWWTFRNAAGAFDPATTISNITLGSGPAPKGFYILNAFNQDRVAASGIPGPGTVSTLVRPRIGAWFQGRVWYAGTDAASGGGNPSTSWSETIYFSQIVNTPSDFGKCYQINDPTSETLNALLPTDGGTIHIQGTGAIWKLFPVLNGLLVFADNGIWFITGSQGIGFAATDYTITKVSGQHAISSTSFVDVEGYPMFWNFDGIYMVMPGESRSSGQRALEVKNLTLQSIKQFYQNIPVLSKLYARGSYNHLTGVVQWVYRNTLETGIISRYKFDTVLNFLTYTEAFYPWTIASSNISISGVDYIELVGSTPATSANPVFKYHTNTANIDNTFNSTFSEEKNNTTFADWSNSFISSFTTAYRLKGMGQRKFQPQYIYVYSEVPTSGYTWQGIWDYAANNLSNKFSALQVINNNKPLFSKHIRKLRVRGNGYVLQQKIGSLDSQPFNISGWSVLDTIGIQ